MTKEQPAAPVKNIDALEMMDFASPNGKFKARLGRIGPVIGTEKLGVMLTVVEPGKRAFPFHVHHELEELFYIIEGTGEYRFGDETHSIRAGDVLAAPTGGPERAHQIINTGNENLKYLAMSTNGEPDVVEYPDSGKFLVYSQSEQGNPQNARIRFIGRTDMSIGYFDGEDD